MFCDYCKALDSVPQRPLLSKLSQFGIDASIVHWVADSSDRVVINGIASDCAAMLSEVLQGLILGPILFFIYVDDLAYLWDMQQYVKFYVCR